MKKIVLKVNFYDHRIKQKAMKTVSGLSGVESISVDMIDKKLTILGNIDPIKAVSKLRKLCQTEIISVGPLKKEITELPNIATPFCYQISLPQYQYYYH